MKTPTKSATPTVVSVINLKGGVGKTTVTALLARYAARRWGLDVLAVDLDSQANLSQALMTKNEYWKLMDEDNPRPSIVELFNGYAPPSKNKPSPSRLDPSDIICHVENTGGWWEPQVAGGKLEIIPSRFDFSDNLIRSTKQDERVLANFIGEHMQYKDLILIDCAPTESILTIASYHASRYVLVPVKTEFFSTIGFPLMEKSLKKFRQNNRANKIDVCGIVVHATETKESRRTKDGQDSWEDIAEKANDYGWDILSNTMYHSDGYPKWAKDPNATQIGNAGHEWPKVAEEILAKIGLRKKEAEQ